jgi:phenylalanyl-tRNA synthetase alpha subunit
MDPEMLEQDALSAVSAAGTVDEVEEVRVRYLGRKSDLKLALREVRDRDTGMTLNAIRERLEAAVDGREEELKRAELDRRLSEEQIDVTVPGTPVGRGHLHLITQIRREVEDIFLGLGYTVVDGREVETTRYNFDAGITLADLLGTLDYLLKALFGEERRTEFRTEHFPFTEPSVEAFVSCHICNGSGCPVCKQSGWIEVGGSGMVDPNLFEFVGYDPEKYTGFAFGWGLERIAVLRHGIPDLRELWRNDPRLLAQF